MKKLVLIIFTTLLLGTLFTGSYLNSTKDTSIAKATIFSLEIAGSGDCDQCEVSDNGGNTIFSCMEADKRCSKKSMGVTVRCNNAEEC